MTTLPDVFVRTKGFEKGLSQGVRDAIGMDNEGVRKNASDLILELLRENPELLWTPIEFTEKAFSRKIKVSVLAVFLSKITEDKSNMEKYLDQIDQLISSYAQEQGLSWEEELELRKSIVISTMENDVMFTQNMPFKYRVVHEAYRIIVFLFQELVQSAELLDRYILTIAKSISLWIRDQGDCVSFLNYVIHNNSQGTDILFMHISGSTYGIIERLRMGLVYEPTEIKARNSRFASPRRQKETHSVYSSTPFYRSAHDDIGSPDPDDDHFSFNKHLLSNQLMEWIEEPRVYEALTTLDIQDMPWVFSRDASYLSLDQKTVGENNEKAIQNYRQTHRTELEEYFMKREAQSAWEAMNTLTQAGLEGLPLQELSIVAENSERLERNTRRAAASAREKIRTQLSSRR